MANTNKRNFVFFQDNAPPHSARKTTAVLKQLGVEVIYWSARYPYMNKIKCLLDKIHGTPTCQCC